MPQQTDDHSIVAATTMKPRRRSRPHHPLPRSQQPHQDFPPGLLAISTSAMAVWPFGGRMRTWGLATKMTATIATTNLRRHVRCPNRSLPRSQPPHLVPPPSLMTISTSAMVVCPFSCSSGKGTLPYGPFWPSAAFDDYGCLLAQSFPFLPAFLRLDAAAIVDDTEDAFTGNLRQWCGEWGWMDAVLLPPAMARVQS